MQFTYAQKQDFYQHGYTLARGVVPQIMIDDALRAINAWVGEGMDREDMTRYRAQSFAPELQKEPVITNLVNATPIISMAESVMGAGNVPLATGGQIALRYPSLNDPPDAPRPHLDGLHTPTNGVPAGTVRNFTMLVVILLSELKAPYSGNFTVWPGTHHGYEAYFKEHGSDALYKGASEGMPQIDLPEPVQIQGQPGDVCFTHYQLGHTAAPNVSPHVRYAAIFRLRHAQRPDPDTNIDALTNLWLEWPGMAEVVG
jgi:hypothetical protein